MGQGKGVAISFKPIEGALGFVAGPLTYFCATALSTTTKRALDAVGVTTFEMGTLTSASNLFKEKNLFMKLGLLGWGAFFIPVVEEFFFRGALQKKLSDSKIKRIALCTLLYTLYHASPSASFLSTLPLMVEMGSMGFVCATLKEVISPDGALCPLTLHLVYNILSMGMILFGEKIS